MFQILANISKEGISCLSDAHEYFNVCYAAGLLPRNFDLSKPQDKTVSKLHPKLVVEPQKIQTIIFHPEIELCMILHGVIFFLFQFHLEAVLSVALEHGLVTFIVSCVQKLGAGSMNTVLVSSVVLYFFDKPFILPSLQVKFVL